MMKLDLQIDVGGDDEEEQQQQQTTSSPSTQGKTPSDVNTTGPNTLRHQDESEESAVASLIHPSHSASGVVVGGNTSQSGSSENPLGDGRTKAVITSNTTGESLTSSSGNQGGSDPSRRESQGILSIDSEQSPQRENLLMASTSDGSNTAASVTMPPRTPPNTLSSSSLRQALHDQQQSSGLAPNTSAPEKSTGAPASVSWNPEVQTPNKGDVGVGGGRRRGGGHIRRLGSAIGFMKSESLGSTAGSQQQMVVGVPMGGFAGGGMGTSHGNAGNLTPRDWPSEIIPGFLFLGGQRAASSQRQMEDRLITRYLCCAVDAPLPKHVEQSRLDSGEVIIKHLKLRDGAKTQLQEHFAEAFKFIRDAKKQHKRVFIYCREGKSRSASIVIAYFIRYMGLTYEEALAAVRCRRSAVDPNFAFCNQLSIYATTEEGQGLGISQVLHARNGSIQSLTAGTPKRTGSVLSVTSVGGGSQGGAVVGGATAVVVHTTSPTVNVPGAITFQQQLQQAKRPSAATTGPLPSPSQGRAARALPEGSSSSSNSAGQGGAQANDRARKDSTSSGQSQTSSSGAKEESSNLFSMSGESVMVPFHQGGGNNIPSTITGGNGAIGGTTINSHNSLAVITAPEGAAPVGGGVGGNEDTVTKLLLLSIDGHATKVQSCETSPAQSPVHRGMLNESGHLATSLHLPSNLTTQQQQQVGPSPKSASSVPPTASTQVLESPSKNLGGSLTPSRRSGSQVGRTSSISAGVAGAGGRASRAMKAALAVDTDLIEMMQNSWIRGGGGSFSAEGGIMSNSGTRRGSSESNPHAALGVLSTSGQFNAIGGESLGTSMNSFSHTGGLNSFSHHVGTAFTLNLPPDALRGGGGGGTTGGVDTQLLVARPPPINVDAPSLMASGRLSMQQVSTPAAESSADASNSSGGGVGGAAEHGELSGSDEVENTFVLGMQQLARHPPNSNPHINALARLRNDSNFSLQSIEYATTSRNSTSPTLQPQQRGGAGTSLTPNKNMFQPLGASAEDLMQVGDEDNWTPSHRTHSEPARVLPSEQHQQQQQQHPSNGGLSSLLVMNSPQAQKNRGTTRVLSMEGLGPNPSSGASSSSVLPPSIPLDVNPPTTEQDAFMESASSLQRGEVNPSASKTGGGGEMVTPVGPTLLDVVSTAAEGLQELEHFAGSPNFGFPSGGGVAAAMAARRAHGSVVSYHEFYDPDGNDIDEENLLVSPEMALSLSMQAREDSDEEVVAQLEQQKEIMEDKGLAEDEEANTAVLCLNTSHSSLQRPAGEETNVGPTGGVTTSLPHSETVTPRGNHHASSSTPPNNTTSLTTPVGASTRSPLVPTTLGATADQEGGVSGGDAHTTTILRSLLPVTESEEAAKEFLGGGGSSPPQRRSTVVSPSGSNLELDQHLDGGRLSNVSSLNSSTVPALNSTARPALPPLEAAARRVKGATTLTRSGQSSDNSSSNEVSVRTGSASPLFTVQTGAFE